MTDKIDKGMSMLNATDETVNPYGLRSGLLFLVLAHCGSGEKFLEAREGFEPSHDGFADHSLRPLGYRASVLLCPNSMPRIMPNAPYFSLLSPILVSLTY